MSCLLHIRRGRWELAWRAIGEESLQPYTFLTFMAEYLMRAAIETPPLPKEAVDVLSWLLAHGYDLGLLVEGLATELKRLIHPKQASQETRRLFCGEALRILAEGMVALPTEARLAGLIFIREFGEDIAGKHLVIPL